MQPRVDTYGLRKTAHVFGAITVEAEPQFTYQFSDVFNGHTFLSCPADLYRSDPTLGSR